MGAVIPNYYQSTLANFDFMIDNGVRWPDWNSNLKVEFYDSQGTLRFTATITSSPALSRETDADGNYYIMVEGISLTSFSTGAAEAWVYADVSGDQAVPYPTKLPAFTVTADVQATIPEPDITIELGDSNWVSHYLVDNDGAPVLNVDYDDTICRYWAAVYTEFQTKNLDSDNFINVGAGEYRVLYEPTEIFRGPFISSLHERSSSTIGFEPDLVVTTAVNTITGTCAITGQTVDFEGKDYTVPVEIIIENLYNPINTSVGSVINPSERYYSDIAGYIRMDLVRGIRVRISIGRYGIIGTVTVPDQAYINIFTLLGQADDEYEPL
jgi:hypothetical protein